MQSLYEQCANPDALKTSLLQAVKTITPSKQRQYVLLAKQVFQAVVVLYARSANHPMGSTSPQSPLPHDAVNATPVQDEKPALTTDPPPVAPVQMVMPPIEQLVIHAGAVRLQSSEPAHHPSAASQEAAAINEAAYTYGDSYGSVLRAISQHNQHFRLKKLLLYVCQDVWESNIQRLLSYNWGGILADFVGSMPNYHGAGQAISQAVQRISKKDEYIGVAQLLLELLTPLLTVDQSPEDRHHYTDAYGSNYSSNYSDNPNDYGDPSSNGAAFIPPSDYNQSHDSDDFSQVLGTAPVAGFVATPLAPTPPAPTSPKPAAVIHLSDFDPALTKDLFDTKLDLMRFANPLRAKILLFSQLYYGFIPDIHDWSDMRNHDLDFLLRQSFYSCATYESLRNSLLATARSLPEPDAYEPAVGYILRVLAPFYDLLKEKQMRHPATDDSKGNRLETGSTGHSGSTTNDNMNRLDDEQTCQFVGIEP